MTIATIHQAKTHLSHYLQQIEQGEEIIIKKYKTPIARIIPYHSLKTTPHQEKKNKRQPGMLKGRGGWIADDFNVSLESQFDTSLFPQK